MKILSRLQTVSKLNTQEYKNKILDELGLGNSFFETIEKEVNKYVKMDRGNPDPKEWWAIYVAGTFFSGSPKYLDGMKEGILIKPEEIENYKDKESISRGLDEIKTLKSALNEKRLFAKQKLKEFDDFVKTLRDEIEEAIEAKESYMDEREEYLDACEKHIESFR